MCPPASLQPKWTNIDECSFIYYFFFFILSFHLPQRLCHKEIQIFYIVNNDVKCGLAASRDFSKMAFFFVVIIPAYSN